MISCRGSPSKWKDCWGTCSPCKHESKNHVRSAQFGRFVSTIHGRVFPSPTRTHTPPLSFLLLFVITFQHNTSWPLSLVLASCFLARVRFIFVYSTFYTSSYQTPLKSFLGRALTFRITTWTPMMSTPCPWSIEASQPWLQVWYSWHWQFS